MGNWLRRLKLPPPSKDQTLPSEKIDEEDEDQTELHDFENDEDDS